MNREANNGSAIVTADLTNITVKFVDTAELVFRDSAGRAMGFGYGTANTLNTLTGPISQEVTGQSNKGLTVQRDFSGAAQGDVINASEVTLTFSTADAAFNFTLNGKYLDGLLPTLVLPWLPQYQRPLEPIHLRSKIS